MRSHHGRLVRYHCTVLRNPDSNSPAAPSRAPDGAFAHPWRSADAAPEVNIPTGCRNRGRRGLRRARNRPSAARSGSSRRGIAQILQAYLTAVIILGHFRRIVLLGTSWPPAEGLKGYAVKTYVTVGLTVLAGAALFETALIPGILIGGVAVLAPRYLPKGALPGLRRASRRWRERPPNGEPPWKPLAGSSRRPARRETSFPNSPSGRRSPRPSPSGSSSPPSISPPTTW